MIHWNRNMDEAPKNGRRILLAYYFAGRVIEPAKWSSDRNAWVTDDCPKVLLRFAVAWSPLNYPESHP